MVADGFIHINTWLAEGFFPIEARSGHRLMSVLVTRFFFLKPISSLLADDVFPDCNTPNFLLQTLIRYITIMLNIKTNKKSADYTHELSHLKFQT